MPETATTEENGRLLAASRTGDNAAPLTVGELSNRLKRAVEEGFGHVRVRGELSGLKRAASGHLYCALKDADAVLDGVMWKGGAARLAFRPEDGLEVIATGRLTTYPGRSKYQIIIEHMELAGEGALLALLERTKARLAAEGLFAAERKQPLPRLPRVIGVVTSPTGAVIRDILHRLRDRFPVHVLVWPVLVQGDRAAGQIADAIAGFDALAAGGAIPRPDLVIVARGGGSIEDLWAFNEEVVVRAAAACRIPLISAVGHETDTTLIDFAADQRAPTPTAAAEMAVPVRAELIATITAINGRMTAHWSRERSRARQRLNEAAERLPGRERMLQPQRQRLDDWAERLPRALTGSVRQMRAELARAAAPLRPALLHRQLDSGRQKLAALERVLQSLDPRALLAKGYALVSGQDGKVITSTDAARAAQALLLSFADGEVAVQVEGTASGPTAPRRPSPAKPRAGKEPLPGLFD